MPKEISKEDLELLEELGVDTGPTPESSSSALEQRIIAGFEEIERFLVEKGRLPEHGESRDIFERLYAVRLDRIRESEECRKVLRDRDQHRILDAERKTQSIVLKEDPTDEELLTSLGLDQAPEEDIRVLTYVRSREEIKAAEEIAQRNPCADFEEFRPIFEKVQMELQSGIRETAKFQQNAEVNAGDLFILDGQKVYVAALGEQFINDYGRPDGRLRVIYDNGTESALLVRSLQRALNKDKASRRISEAGWGPLFSDEEEENDLATGYIYVLRSKSEHPFIAEHRSVIHKIGVTGGDVKKRIGNAKKDPTFLLADVELVATFKLSNIKRNLLEALLHKFFGTARLDMELKDRFGGQVEPREWFLAPFSVIEEAIQKLKDGTIADSRYDPKSAKIVSVSKSQAQRPAIK